MKKVLFLIFVLLSASNLFGQDDSTTISFVSYWSVGDSYTFNVKKTKQRWSEGKLSQDQNQEYKAEFTVIDSTESSYTINWSFTNDLENTYNIPAELLHKFSKYQLTEIKYKTSEVGEIQEILNWKEIGELMNNMFNDMIDVLGKDDQKKQNAIRKAMQPLQKIYSSQQGVEQLIMKELQYFHYPMGLEYNISEPILYEDELPNMFGGKPIKAAGKFYFEDVDFEKYFCVIKQELSLNPEDTKGVMLDVFKRMKFNDNEIKKALKTASLEINDRNTFEYYYFPGIPHKIETVRETTFNLAGESGKGIDKMVIELVYPE